MPRRCTRAKPRHVSLIAASLTLSCAISTLAPAHANAQTASDRPNSAATPRPKSTAAPSAATPTSPSGSASAPSTNPTPTIPTGDPLSDLRLVPIDPGTEDISRLREGGRQMPVDLRKPLNFEQVYRVEGDLSRLGVLGVSPLEGQAMYARASGGLVAIFPQSEYVRTRRGPFPVVPANTTFLLGSIQTPTTMVAPRSAPGTDTASTSSVTPASAAQRVDTRATASQPAEVMTPKPRREPPSIWNSEVARRSRLSHLLDQAKAADAHANPDPAQPDPAPTPASDP